MVCALKVMHEERGFVKELQGSHSSGRDAQKSLHSMKLNSGPFPLLEPILLVWNYSYSSGMGLPSKLGSSHK